MLESLRLQNFTCFSDLQLEFVPGVNVFVGENGTGKTHILKVIHSYFDYPHQGAPLNQNQPDFGSLHNHFRTYGTQIGRLVRKGAEEGHLTTISSDGSKLVTTIRQNSTQLTSLPQPQSERSSVYIAAKEILSNAPGFRSLYKMRYISYEAHYPQMLDNAELPALRELPAEIVKLADEIEQVIGGKVEVRGEEFFINDIEMPLIAEGHRKLALIWLLLHNGLIGKDTVLVWDEPEANLNPVLISLVAKTLLKLAELGTQVFLATHSYVFLKTYFLLLAQEALTETDLDNLTDKMRKACLVPTSRGKQWKSGFNTFVLNLKAWNAAFPQHTIERIENT